MSATTKAPTGERRYCPRRSFTRGVYRAGSRRAQNWSNNKVYSDQKTLVNYSFYWFDKALFEARIQFECLVMFLNAKLTGVCYWAHVISKSLLWEISKDCLKSQLFFFTCGVCCRCSWPVDLTQTLMQVTFGSGTWLCRSRTVVTSPSTWIRPSQSRLTHQNDWIPLLSVLYTYVWINDV